MRGCGDKVGRSSSNEFAATTQRTPAAQHGERKRGPDAQRDERRDVGGGKIITADESQTFNWVMSPADRPAHTHTPVYQSNTPQYIDQYLLSVGLHGLVFNLITGASTLSILCWHTFLPFLNTRDQTRRMRLCNGSISVNAQLGETVSDILSVAFVRFVFPELSICLLVD